MQKFLMVFSFALIPYCAVAADGPDNTANGFIKADFQREISVPALTRLLGAGVGYLFVANESGGVEVLTAEGKRAYSLEARSGETRLLKRPEAAAVADDIVGTSKNSFCGRIAALRGARNPHVLQYTPVPALRAPCTSSRKSEFLEVP